MRNTLTVIIPNRNRSMVTLKRSLDSINSQLTDATQVVIVDYGSDLSYQSELQKLTDSFSRVDLILCPTQGQLWSKSRCINMVLTSCTTTHLMVGDMDMIWHPEFLKTQLSTFPAAASVYYTVGIMTQEESALEKTFLDYDIKFATGEEATGISVFPAKQLKSINGFDEFFHGWGSEDTDVHMRLQHAGYNIHFYNKEVYFKHQWHAKSYRSKQSPLPFHPLLERINHRYFLWNQYFKKIKANHNDQWGILCNPEEYRQLESPSMRMKLDATREEIKAFTYFTEALDRSVILELKVSPSPNANSLKTRIKKVAGKKTAHFISIEQANEMLLESIIKSHRNCPYHYSFDREKAVIHLVIYLKRNL
ncbi:glycosyltransferase family 2 protein [Nonlabens sp.]|uniref:glycosyltransferase family 2 protein n=1 Tax=Nonlabens sp. TaxID=1888209 RepID=UPI001BCAB183|nr:galactosyltransferase-related protein [Nonlabens sp.]